MKEYISRLKQGCRKEIAILWWAMRAFILVAFIANFSSDTFTLNGQIQIAMCFLGSFGWELSMLSSKKSLFRFMPSSIHTALNIGLFVSAVVGVWLNFYFSTRFLDTLLQLYFSFISVLYGYEIGYAIVKRDRIGATKAMLFFVAFGVSFINFNIWELGEFFTDQLLGHLTGQVGNAQMWSQALAEGTARAQSFIHPIVPERLPLMDIMHDIITHSASAFAALIFINVFPYRLRGKYKYNAEYENNATIAK